MVKKNLVDKDGRLLCIICQKKMKKKRGILVCPKGCTTFKTKGIPKENIEYIILSVLDEIMKGVDKEIVLNEFKKR